MLALIFKEFVQLRNYILQVALAMIAAILLFGNSLEGFLVTYLNILPLVMALTLPQFLFSMEERGNTMVFLRTLPVRPRQIVASKYVVSALLIAGLMLVGLVYSWSACQLTEAINSLGFNLIIAAALLGLSHYLHFRLGANAAKVGLLVSLMLFALLGMAVMQNQEIAATLRSLLQSLAIISDGWLGVLAGLVVSTVVMLLSYAASATTFSRQDLSNMP